MKILIVRTFPDILDPSKYNIQEIGLARALTRRGHNCGIVLYYGKNKDNVEKLPVNGQEIENDITIYRLHGYNFLKNGIYPSLKRIIRQYDIIQVHEYDQITSWLIYAWSNKPVVIYHGPYYHAFNKGYNLKCMIFDHTFLKIRQNRNVACITKSHAAAEFLKSRGFYNVFPVGVGLDIENFDRTSTLSNNPILIDNQKINLVYVGKIEERRNSIFLIDVMKRVCELNENVRCIIIGDGEKNYLDRFLNKSSSMIESEKLKYYKSATQEQLSDVYKKSQIMLFPTNYDIFGMVLLEAMYFDLAVVSSCNGGADMLIQDKKNGFMISKLDEKEWVETVLEIINKRMYEQVKSNLRNMNHKVYTWDFIAEKMIEIYSKEYQIDEGKNKFL